MPQLKNQKHELFCRNLFEGAKRGWSATEAYIRSGYSDKGVGPRVGASRLLTKPNITARLAELSAPAVRKTAFTAAEAHEKLSAVYAGAVASEQYGAARGAVETQAKIAGLMIDRLEVGEVGEFAGCTTVEAVVDKLIEREGPAEALATLDLLRQMLADRAGDQALVISPDVGIDVGIEPEKRWKAQ